MAVILGIHANLFGVTRALKKGLQLTSEGETLILTENSTKIRFDKKTPNNRSEGFILTTKFYKKPNNAAILVPDNQNT